MSRKLEAGSLAGIPAGNYAVRTGPAEPDAGRVTVKGGPGGELDALVQRATASCARAAGVKSGTWTIQLDASTQSSDATAKAKDDASTHVSQCLGMSFSPAFEVVDWNHKAKVTATLAPG